jgi:phosphohistidine swiveling domain-containing protein
VGPRHPLADPKWTLPETGATARITRAATFRRVEENLERRGLAWLDPADDVFSARDGAEVSEAIFAQFQREERRKYFAGCEAAVRDAPDRYVLRADLEPAPAASLPEGVIGVGDNVFEHPDVVGTVMVIRHVSDVEELMSEGVPDDTIAVIDDAGGTMTAPILPFFVGVVCLAGSVRSHLAIVAREFEVPLLMGVRLRRTLQTGERISVGYSAPAQHVDAYFTGQDLRLGAEIRLASSES